MNPLTFGLQLYNDLCRYTATIDCSTHVLSKICAADARDFQSGLVFIDSAIRRGG